MVVIGEWLVYGMQISFIPTWSASIVINSITSQSATEESFIHMNFPPILVGIIRE